MKKISHLIYVHANWIMSCTNESNPEKARLFLPLNTVM